MTSRITPSARTRLQSFTRAVLVLALAIGCGGVVLSARGTVPTSAAGWSSWSGETDVVAAALPVLVLVLLTLTGAMVLSIALYATLRALGLARTAATLGWLVVPRIRRRIDRLIAVGVLASVITCTANGARAYADDGSIVRDPAVATVPVELPSGATDGSTDVVREPGGDDATPIPDEGAPDVTPPAPVPTPSDDGPDPTGDAGTDPTDRSIDPGGAAGIVREDDAPGAPTAPARGGETDAAADATHSSRDDEDRDRGQAATRGGANALNPRGAVPGVDALRDGGRADGSNPANPGAAAASRYTVVAGDDLWAIAARRVATARGTDAANLTAADIAPYWVQVVEANRATIRSGNPSLIYAGEVLTLPAVA